MNKLKPLVNQNNKKRDSHSAILDEGSEFE